MPSLLFWIFSILMLGCGVMVVAMRNPVSSALSMVISFVGIAGLFIGMSAFFIGIIQILVYAGAIMVLFLFIIMLLDLKLEEKRAPKMLPLVGGLAVVFAFVIQLIGVLSQNTDKAIPSFGKEGLAQAAAHYSESPKIAQSLATGELPDVHLTGQTLFTQYNFPLQIIGVLLLVATVGVVVLSKRQTN